MLVPYSSLKIECLGVAQPVLTRIFELALIDRELLLMKIANISGRTKPHSSY